MSLKQNRALSTKAKILSSAENLISQYGYDHVSVDQIVADCGIAKGTFYHHFKSKEELSAQLCATLYNDMKQEITAMNYTSSLEKLICFVDNWHQKVSVHNIHFARQAIKLYTDPIVVGECGEQISQMDQGISLLHELLSEAVGSGELTDEAPVDTLSKAIMFAMQGSTIYHCKHGQDFDVLCWNIEFRNHVLIPLLTPYISHKKSLSH